MKELNTYFDQLLQVSTEYAPTVLLAIITLVGGWWLANRLSNLLGKKFKKSGTLDPGVETFITSISTIGMKILVVISVAGIIGIETTSFVGIVAAMGFAIGLALQGNLSNFAAGIIILLMRPFKVKDEVKIQDIGGFVYEIQIFHTVIRNYDKTFTIIPNSKITSAPIQNKSTSPIRRVSVKLNIPYSEDFEKVKTILIEAGLSISTIDSSMQPRCVIKTFDDHFIRISVNFFTSIKGFWGTKRALNEALLRALKENDIQIAYPTGVAFGAYANEGELDH